MYGRARMLSRSDQFCLLSSVAFILAAPPLWAASIGQGLININQHQVAARASCPPIAPLPPFHGVPDPDAGPVPNVNAFSYHIKPDTQGDNYFLGARCYDTLGRTRVLSDDWPHNTQAEKAQRRTHILDVCERALSFRGDEHYEHFQEDLETRAEWGNPITRWSDFPGSEGERDTAKGFLDWISDFVGPGALERCSGMLTGSQVVPLTQNGTLSTSNERLTWEGNYATLIGYGFMGAVAAEARGEAARFNSAGYLRALRFHGVNLTRVWALDQWVSQAICDDTVAEAPTPFGGSLSGTYNVTAHNGEYFRGLRHFVQEAADRGIVVQLSLYDKHGLTGRVGDPNCAGKWPVNPFRDAENSNPYLDDPTCLDNCKPLHCPQQPCESECGPAQTFEEPPPEVPEACFPSTGFADETIPDDAVPRQVHEDYLRRMAQEVGGTGNVIFEVINEAVKDVGGSNGGDWNIPPNQSLDLNETWQLRNAEYLRFQLPILTARDAFNEAPRGLNGKPPDAGPNWVAHNALINSVLDIDPPPIPRIDTGLLLGSIKGRACPPDCDDDTYGELSLERDWTPNLATGFAVRADVTRNAAKMAIGVKEGDGDSLYVELQPCSAPCDHVVFLRRMIGTQVYDIVPGGVQLTTVAPKGNVWLRLVQGSPYQLAWVSYDDAAVPGMSGVSTSVSLNPSRAYFRGWVEPGQYYYPSYGEIDNFEADVYCNNNNMPACNPDVSAPIQP